jgi:hypothetical protein
MFLMALITRSIEARFSILELEKTAGMSAPQVQSSSFWQEVMFFEQQPALW